MNRWPRVVLPAAMPSTVSGTTVAPASSDRMHRIECSGRTHRRPPVPHRMDLGQGKLRIVASSTSATMSAAGRPGLVTVAYQTCPFLSSRACSWSRVSPVERKKPSSAASGASVRGPLRSSCVVGLAAVRPSTARARRRGVLKAPALA